MSPSKTQRRKAASRARYEAYLERRAKKQRRRLLVQRVLVGVLVLALVGTSAWWLIVSRSTDEVAAPTPTPPALQWDEPEQVLEEGTPATATLTTNRGVIVVDLATDDAPQASNSMAFLAAEGYFDQTPCHRLTAVPKPAGPLFVLQCGDRSGTGAGPGPGYTLPDENLPETGDGNYPAGTVAMAEPAGGQAGSQFFIVYRDSTLPPSYTIVGTVTDGLDVVRRVAAAGIAQGAKDGAPVKPVTLETMTAEQGSAGE